MAQDVQEPKPKKDWSQLFTRHIPTPMERLQGIGYGVASGAAQALGGTVEALGLITEQGAKALGQDETPFSEGVQSFGRSISALPEGMRPKKQRAAEGLGVEAAQAVGSGLGFAAQTLAGGGLLRLARFAPQAAAWVAGGGTGILGNFASGYNDALAETGNREAAGWAYQQALDRGESPQQAMIAYGDVLRQTGDRTKALQSGWLNGTISGPLEVAGLGGVVGKVLGNADDATGGSISKAILKMVTEEGGQEGFAQLVENVGAYLVEYDEDRALMEGVAKSTALGGLAGGIVGGPLEVASRLMAAKESGPSGDQGDVQGPPSEGRAVLRPEDAQVATNEMLKAQGLAIQAKPTSAATEEEREAAAYFERRGGQAVFVDQPADGTKVHPAYYHRPTRTAVFARGGPEGSIRKRFRIHEMGHHLAEVSRGHWQELGKALTELDPQGVAEQREAIRPDYEGLTPEAFEEEVVTTYLEDRGGLLLEGDKFEALARKPGLLRTVVDAIIRQLNRIPGIKIEERTTAALRRLRDQLAETDLERGIDPTLLPAMSATVRAGLDAIVGRAQPAQQQVPAQAAQVSGPAGNGTAAQSTIASSPDVRGPAAPGSDPRGGPNAASGPPSPVRSPSAADPQLIRAQRKEREARKADLAASIYKAAGKPERAAQMRQEAARRRGPQRGETARRAQPTRAQAAVEAYEAGADGGFAVARTPEFQRWFGDSKVVDEQGHPRVVYHGSGTRIDAFSYAFAGRGNDQLGSGFYFTTDRTEADKYQTRTKDEANKLGGAFAPTTTDAFLALQNPLDADASGTVTAKQAAAIIRKAPASSRSAGLQNWNEAGRLTPQVAQAYAFTDEVVVRKLFALANDFYGTNVRAFNEAVRDVLGFDGVVKHFDNGTAHYVAWFPEQIKSATDNRGTFDPHDPDIRFAVPPERRQAARERVRALQQQAFAEGEGTSIGNDPAPVRAKPTADPQERAMWRGVDAWRDENDRLIRISHDEQEERAERGLRDARQSTEAAIRGALSDGDAGRILEPWEMVAAAKLVQERMRDAFHAAPGAARDAAYSDALELADAVRANRARTAQALGIFQDALSSPREQLVDAITAPQAEGARKMREQREKAKRGATLTERERARKELEKVQRTEAAKARKIADALQKAGLHPEQLPESELADLEVQAEIMRVASSSVSSATSKLKEWRYASMLSALLTHKANVVGNAIYNSIGHVERVAEAAVNLAVRAPDAAQAGELVPYFTSFFQSFGKAGSNFMRSWRTERDAWEMHLQETGRAQAEGVRLDLWGGPAIPGKLGRVVRAPLRALKAEDAFFKTLVGLPEAQAQAYRVAHSEGKRGRELTLRMQEILADPAHSIWAKVQEEVLRRTFQKPGDPQGDMADKILWLLLRARTAVPGGDFVLPFVTTPFRIFEEAFGLAFAPGILAGKAVVWPKTYGKNKAQLARDTARALLSSAVGLALLSMLNGEDDEGRPLVTGTRPSSRGEADLAYRTVPPYHIKVLGEYRDYSRLEPLATILASLVDTAKAAKDDPVRAMPAFFRSVYEQMGDKTFLQTIGDVQDALERPSGRAGVELVRDTFITPMFPNIARQTAREMDPFFRQEEVWPMDRKATSTAHAAVESLPYAILPARGIAPPIRYDLWGRPSQKFDPNVSPLGRYVSKIVNPFPGSTLPEVHALDRVISRFNERVDAGELVGMDDTVGKHFSKTAPDTTTTVAGQPVFFTPTEYARLQEVAGKRSSERLLELLAKRRIDAENPTERDMDIIDKVINQSRQQVRSEILAARGLPVARLKAANKER